MRWLAWNGLLVVLLVVTSCNHVRASTTSNNSTSTQTASQQPHCSSFQSHCVFNTTTSSCTFRDSVAFHCGVPDDNATSTAIQWSCRWELTGDLLIEQGVTVSVVGDDCFLKLSVGKMLVLEPLASLQAASLSVDASFVRVERNASVVAQYGGASYRGHQALFMGDDRIGASHGGSGGMRLHLNATTSPQQKTFGAFFDARASSTSTLSSIDMVVRAAGAWDLEELWTAALTKPTTSMDCALLLLGSGSVYTTNTSSATVPAGGRIRIVSSRDLVLMPGASIRADGGNATSTDASGGSGGTVFLSATAFSLTDAVVQARGGHAFCAANAKSVNDCVAAGGGGRVHIAFVSSQLDDHAVDVRGGSLVHTGDDDDNKIHAVEERALGGACGTYLRVTKVKATASAPASAQRRSSATDAAMILANGRPVDDDGNFSVDATSVATPSGGAVTFVVIDATHRHIDSLLVHDGAVLATNTLLLPKGDLSIRNGSYLVDDSVSTRGGVAAANGDTASSAATEATIGAVAITARNVVFSSCASVLWPVKAGVIQANALSVDASVALRFTQSVTLTTVHTLHMEAAVQSVPSVDDGDAPGSLTLVSGQDVWLGGKISVGTLAVRADASITVDAATIDVTRPAPIDATFQPCDPQHTRSNNNNSVDATSTASVASFRSFATASNFTMLLQAAQSISIGGHTVADGKSPSSTTVPPATVALLTASGILLCAEDEILVADGAIITSNGRGEQANQGPGSGDCVGSVGGGGGYGGRGADSSAVNELGDYASGGLAYGTRAGVGLLGSGGGCVDGGASGGVVMVGARGVVLDGQVHCNGDGGVKSGGGGSGGFLGLTIAEYLRGHGKISAVGGGAQCMELADHKALRKALEKPQKAGEDLNTTTTVVLAVHSLAVDSVSESTAAASTVVTRVCGGGGGGGRLQLHGCELIDLDQCTAGFDGNYTVSGGSTSLVRADQASSAASSSTPSSSSTLPSSSTGQPASSTTVDEMSSASSGSFVGFPCLPGSGGLFCRVCATGTFKAESNSEECMPCTNAPSNAHYKGHGATTPACLWTCDPGYSGMNCVSPIQQLLDACGGFFGFAVVLLSIVLFLILLGYACRSKKEPSYTRNVGRGGANSHGVGGGGSNGPKGGVGGGASGGASGGISGGGVTGSTSERQHLLSSVIASTQRSRFAFLVRWLYWVRVGYPKLVERDLPEHMARIYFTGLNDRDAPLKLRVTVPLALRNVLYDDEFRTLAERINTVLAWPSGIFASWGELVYRLVVVACYPAASAVMAYRRHLRINALKRIIARYNHACMKGPRARGLLNALKLGYSGDYSLVYLELLYKESSQSTCVPTTAIGKPTLPQVLLFAGRGTYECPLYLDPSDLLVRSIPQCPALTAFIDEPWIEFVAELNELLRVVSRHEVELVETLLPVAQFLEAKMAPLASGNGQDKGATKMGGLRIYLGRFYVGDDLDCGEEFKLGLLLSTIDSERDATMQMPPPSYSTLNALPSRYGYGTTATNTMMDPVYGGGSSSGRLLTDDALLLFDPVAGGWSRDQAQSQAQPLSGGARGYYGGRRGSQSGALAGGGAGPSSSYKTTSSSIRDDALRIRSNTSGSVDNLLTPSYSKTTNDFDANEFLYLQPTSSRTNNNNDFQQRHQRPGQRQRGQGQGHGQRVRRRRKQTFYEGWLGPVDASLPVPGVLISADELDDRLADRTKNQQIEAFCRRHLLPRNVPSSQKFPWASSWMAHGALLFLLMVDLAITFAMVVNLRCVVNGQVDKECSAAILVPVLLLPPLTLFLAPIMGIVSLAIASNSFSRRYSKWNALSMVNVGVAILTCLTQSSRLVAPWFTAPVPLLPVIAMVVKGGEAFLIERYIALQETNRKRRGWRGLMKRRLSDASIPPESPYSSPVSSASTPSYLTAGATVTGFR